MIGVLAQEICTQTKTGPECVKGPLEGIETLADVVNKLMLFLIPLAAIILFLVLVWGGFDYMTSAGNPEKTKSAQAKLTSAVIGFILLFLAYAIVKVIELVFGFGGGII